MGYCCRASHSFKSECGAYGGAARENEVHACRRRCWGVMTPSLGGDRGIQTLLSLQSYRVEFKSTFAVVLWVEFTLQCLINFLKMNRKVPGNAIIWPLIKDIYIWQSVQLVHSLFTNPPRLSQQVSVSEGCEVKVQSIWRLKFQAETRIFFQSLKNSTGHLVWKQLHDDGTQLSISPCVIKTDG